MVYIKKPEEIAVMKSGGQILASILDYLISILKPETSTAYLEKIAENMIIEAGGRPAFKNYPLAGDLFFPSALCVSINNEVVHGASLPDRIIKSGDIVNLDIGMEWPIDKKIREKYNFPVNKYSKLGGFYTDTCRTVGVGKISKEASHLIRVTKKSLELAIEILKPGIYLHQIGKIIETIALKNGFRVVEDFVGHGLGYYAHEKPDILNYAFKPYSYYDLELKTGMVIAIEPMINIGSSDVKIADNGFTALTKDGSLSAHFEHSVVITDNSYLILTKK